MEKLSQNKPSFLPFAHLSAKLTRFLEEKDTKMLCVKLKNFLMTVLLVFVVSSILFATVSFAADKDSGLFSDLIKKGGEMFEGMREIIYAVAGFGVVAVAIGGFFGNLNWKWLTAIILGLVVIATTASIINYMVDDDITQGAITDTLKSGNSVKD